MSSWVNRSRIVGKSHCIDGFLYIWLGNSIFPCNGSIFPTGFMFSEKENKQKDFHLNLDRSVITEIRSESHSFVLNNMMHGHLISLDYGQRTLLAFIGKQV